MKQNREGPRVDSPHVDSEVHTSDREQVFAVVTASNVGHLRIRCTYILSLSVLMAIFQVDLGQSINQSIMIFRVA